MKVFNSSKQHILAELERIDLLIQVQVQAARKLSLNDIEFRGLYVSEEEVDVLLEQPAGIPTWANAESSSRLQNLWEKLDSMDLNIKKRVEASRKKGISLRLVELAELFNLSSFDVDAVLVCMASELDPRYERLYAYLQDDVTKKHPEIDLVLNLLCSNFELKMQARERFFKSAPLMERKILREISGQNSVTFIGKGLCVDERIIRFLFDSDDIDALLPQNIRLDNELSESDIPIIHPDHVERLGTVLHKMYEEISSALFYFHGSKGVGKLATAKALCQGLGINLLVVESERLFYEDKEAFRSTVDLICREALLQKAAIFWRNFDHFFGEGKESEQMTFLDVVQVWPVVMFAGGALSWEPTIMSPSHLFMDIEFERPEYSDRLALWEYYMDAEENLPKKLDLDSLANKFRFGGGQIRDAVISARRQALWREPDNGTVNEDDLYVASRRQSNHKLASLAQHITPHYTWDDIVLPDRLTTLLQEVCNHVKYRSKVYGEWEFDKKLSLGKGLNVLFAGPPGTGKTMAADVIANELSLDLYKIDLSTVISKYIGETEKNLAKIFSEAEDSNAILFFDEADALFGKRTEVRDSHDRYANIEVSYLLQKMEEFEGVSILTTNLHKNMDDAFVRRMHFTLEFPIPSIKERLLIWENIWPKATPRNLDMDLEFIARKFEITGGSIRNIALSAAFLAAQNGGNVNMDHLIQATRREYKKMGKVLVAGEFGEYANLKSV